MCLLGPNSDIYFSQQKRADEGKTGAGAGVRGVQFDEARFKYILSKRKESRAEEKRGPILLNREDPLATGVFAGKRFISSTWTSVHVHTPINIRT